MIGLTHDRARVIVLLVVLMGCVSGCLAASALAMSEGPGWELTANSYPTNLPPGETGTIVVSVMNVGAGSSSGAVTVTDTLPPNVKATEAGELERLTGIGGGPTRITHSEWDCTGNGGGSTGVEGASVVTCTNDPVGMPSLAGGGGNPAVGGPVFVEHDEHGELRDNLDTQIAIGVSASTESAPETNRVSIAGGGAPTSASTTDPVTVSSTTPPFGYAGWDVWFSNADGTLDTQAGSHPYEATFSYNLNNMFEGGEGYVPAGGQNRSIEVKLPPGLIGDPEAVPQCTRQELDNSFHCPPGTQVGIISVTVAGGLLFRSKVFNMVPPAGVPNELAFNLENIRTRLDQTVRSGSDYGLTTHVADIPEEQVIGSVLTIWGVPGEASHDMWRSARKHGCSLEEIKESRQLTSVGGEGCPQVNEVGEPFLTLPTSCGAPLKFSIWGDVWQHPEMTGEKSVETHDNNGVPTGLTGCESMIFGPVMSVAPDTGQADSPAGLTVEVKPPAGGLVNPGGLGSSDIKNTTVTLPEGVVINPGQAAGLEACQPSEAHIHVENSPPECPLKSKVGTVEAELPILEHALQGNVYVLQSDPPNLELLLSASGDGIEVKLPIHVHLNETTGQLTATLLETPQAPVSNFKLSFSGGAQAALATPTHCGTYTATSDFTPWASPFVADVSPTGSFAVSSGSGGAPCPGAVLPFTPGLIAGSTTDQAGGFTDFSLLLQAPDDQQRIEKLQFKVPQGLLGMISRVPLCPEPQASTGTCSSASQIGHTVVASGPGPYPLVVPQPGQPPAAIYLTGPYKGAPYGLSIVVPVVVGPFTLETQIVRARIEVDPLTAQITVTTDALPQVIDGVPTDLRTVNAVIDRPGFMFNPTNCSPSSFSGAAYSAQGATAPISSPFQMGSCRSLLFKPDLIVSTSGKTSRKNGASLDAKIVYPTTPLGANQASSQSNIKSVKVDLPKQLPSRLTTLQKACIAATFEADPANCPTDSRVGTVSAVTPVLPVTLTGPAYFVSYGGAKFPELVFALQGYGVTIYVHGETFISKAGITSSTFRQVPDVPIYSFELQLPQGPFSALAANGNLCKSKLTMPTAFTAQDGATINQTTQINVTGCPKTKKIKPKAHKTKHSTKGKSGK
jgi:hypothetical protein